MGLFSGKTITQVGTSIQRVVEDDLLPNSKLSALIRSILEGSDIVNNTTTAYMGSVGVKAERMYRWAKDNYVHGLPSGAMLSNTRGRAEVSAVLEAIHGTSVLLDYCQMGPPNALHIGWLKLQQLYGHDSTTNELPVLSQAKGKTVYLHDMAVLVPESMVASLEPGALSQWGAAAKGGFTPQRKYANSSLAKLVDQTPPEIRNDIAEDLIRVEYVWEDEETTVIDGKPVTKKVIKQESLTYPVDDYDAQADFFHVKYSLGTTGFARYWMYQLGSGAHPTLDAILNAPQEVINTFFPFGYFRYNKTSENADKGTETYRDGKKLAKLLGMDFDQIADGINENPDIADVEQAMWMFAVPAYSENALEQRYLFHFFENMFYAADEQFMNKDQADIWGLYHGEGDPVRNALVIKDNRFKMVLANGGIYRRRIAGSIGPVGSYACAKATETITEKVQTIHNYETMEVVESEISFTVPLHTYRRQVTEFLYDEITVLNLRTAYEVSQNWLTMSDENSEGLLLVPIDRSITEDYKASEREELYSRALQYVFNSKVVTKLKWYQTGIFQVIIIIVAIVLTIADMGTDGGSWIATALELTGTQAIVATVIFNMVVGQLISVGLQALGRAIGGKWAVYLAVAVAVIAGYQAVTKGALTSLPSAANLLAMSNGLMTVGTAGMNKELGDLIEDFTSLQEHYEDLEKSLESAKNLLENNSLLSPFIIFGEKPEDFYNRTVHSGNVGVAGYDILSSYVDIALMLPTLNETIGTEDGDTLPT